MLQDGCHESQRNTPVNKASGRRYTKLGCKEVCAPEEEVGVGVETTSLIVSCGKLEDAEGELISESELKLQKISFCRSFEQDELFYHLEFTHVYKILSSSMRAFVLLWPTSIWML